ncbi:hypothetical protein Q2317_25790, partial [Escherichia coli]|nr:hypothetical protein [Escherichia coli]
RNATLRTWWPVVNDLDPLLDRPENEKVKAYTDENFSVRVAYQSPIQVTFKGTTGEALSYTLEDAIVMANLELFEKLPGTGLIAKFRDAITGTVSYTHL